MDRINVGLIYFFFFQAEDGIRDHCVTGVQTCALPIWGFTEVYHQYNSFTVYYCFASFFSFSASIDRALITQEPIELETSRFHRKNLSHHPIKPFLIKYHSLIIYYDYIDSYQKNYEIFNGCPLLQVHVQAFLLLLGKILKKTHSPRTYVLLTVPSQIQGYLGLSKSKNSLGFLILTSFWDPGTGTLSKESFRIGVITHSSTYLAMLYDRPA